MPRWVRYGPATWASLSGLLKSGQQGGSTVHCPAAVAPLLASAFLQRSAPWLASASVQWVFGFGATPQARALAGLGPCLCRPVHSRNRPVPWLGSASAQWVPGLAADLKARALLACVSAAGPCFSWPAQWVPGLATGRRPG